MATLPVDLNPQEGGVGVKNQRDFKEDFIEEAPPSGFKAKG